MRSAVVVARLLESDLDFHTKLGYGPYSSSGHGLQFHGPADVRSGTLDVYWTLEIDAREWGIKEMVPTVKRVVLHGFLDAEVDERMVEGEEFSYDSNEKGPTAALGADVDAPTQANAMRLATQWKLEWGLNKYPSEDKNPTSFIPTAEVDVARKFIQIEF